MKKLSSLAILAIFFISCSSETDDSNGAISEQALSGTVQGSTFLATGGKSFVNNNGSVSIILTNTVADCPTNILDFVYYISTDVPNRIGLHENVIVVFGKENKTPVNVLNSTVEVSEITDTQIIGKIKSQSVTEENKVEGIFTVNICDTSF